MKRINFPSKAGGCARCNDEGFIRTWCGRAGEGGLVGPCPRCSPVPVIKGFLSELAARTFPILTPEQKFTRTFTNGD